jgi:ubiquitin-protein ligase E3 C
VSRTIYDKVFTYELVPNGSQMKVTNANLHEYIHRYAYYQQNSSIVMQCNALLKGFRELIPVPWIRMFNTKELQMLINGETRKIDLFDLQTNLNYAGGYHESQPYIQEFWKIIDEMTIDDQKNFLKFVTSSIRQPLLGFGQLNPKFCIQKVSQFNNIPLGSDHHHNPATFGAVPRLPSAATCMNLLKLPQYESVNILKEKLLYAIRSNSGFELS